MIARVLEILSTTNNTTATTTVTAATHNSNKMSFTSKELITTDKDLIRYLKKIPKAMKFIGNGALIIPYDKLLTLKHNIFSKKKKMAIVLNSSHSQEIYQTTGHWLLLALDLRDQSRHCLLIDSLASVYKDKKDIKNTIDTFCSTHHLSLSHFNLVTQSRKNLGCGYFLIFNLRFFTVHNIPHFVKLKRLLKNYSLLEREKYILERSYKLCKFGFLS